jgi:hypothetical protein
MPAEKPQDFPRPVQTDKRQPFSLRKWLIEGRLTGCSRV